MAERDSCDVLTDGTLLKNASVLNNRTVADYDLADNHKLIAGSLSFFLVLPFVLFTLPCFPIGCTSALLCGAGLMVLTGVVSQAEVYEIIGEAGNLRTIYLMLGMMLLFQYFDREGLITRVLSVILRDGLKFHNYLLRINLITFILAAIFTDPISCVVLTPLFLKNWVQQKRPFHELDIILIGIITSANIGSVVTVFGNPQMALMASKTSQPLFTASRLDLRRTLVFLMPCGILAVLLNWFFLCAYARWISSNNKSCYRKIFSLINNTSNPKTSHPATAASGGCINGLAVGENSSAVVLNGYAIGDSLESKKEVCQSETTISLSHTSLDDSASGSKPFMMGICILLLLVICVLLASTPKLTFDMGLVPMAASVIAIVLDALLNKRNAFAAFKRVDWDVVMMFFGIYVWMDGFNRTRLPRWLWAQLGFADAGAIPSTAGGLAIFAIFVTFGSNLFNNVPLTIIVLEQLQPCEDQFELILYLAWIATIAGNLTLFGSASNLIVVNKSLETVGHHLTFWNYLKFGFPATLLFDLIGVFVLMGLLLIPGIKQAV